MGRPGQHAGPALGAVVVAELGADDLARWIRVCAERLHAEAGRLTELDAAIGDADHGSNLDRGFTAAVAKIDAEAYAGPGPLLKAVGMTLVSTVGGASGPLYGTFFLRCGTALGDGTTVDATALGTALRAGVAGVQGRGKAEAGDKTMYDAWSPAVDAYEAAVTAGDDLGPALRAAADAAAAGRDATIDLVARKGRASYLGERSRGHLDPGATSTTMILEAAAATLS
jgi:phosphoenolpyruvate---glycerone phosphotransferase subunit DhaL